MSRSPIRFVSVAALCANGLLLLLLLAGCAGQQIETKEATPSVEIPPGWDLSANNGEQDWPDSSWWRKFGSDELSQLVAEGQASNLEIAAAISRVHQAQAQARIAGAPLLPNVDFYTSINRALPLASNGTAATSTSGLLEIGYEVDF
jgi:multidrug efflux system outer membrane protein